jgi:hypothetical protein
MEELVRAGGQPYEPRSSHCRPGVCPSLLAGGVDDPQSAFRRGRNKKRATGRWSPSPFLSSGALWHWESLRLLIVMEIFADAPAHTLFMPCCASPNFGATVRPPNAVLPIALYSTRRRPSNFNGTSRHDWRGRRKSRPLMKKTLLRGFRRAHGLQLLLTINPPKQSHHLTYIRSDVLNRLPEPSDVGRALQQLILTVSLPRISKKLEANSARIKPCAMKCRSSS